MAGRSEEPSESRGRPALEEIREAQRSAHLELDADRLVRNIADELVSVDRDVITVQTRAEVPETFASYFESWTVNGA